MRSLRIWSITAPGLEEQRSVIISASRRTDIPALYHQWFMNRIRDGFCLVPNPFNRRQISRVSLKVEDVDALVFWSKNPHPMLKHLDELDRLEYPYYFLFTLNDYPSELEPGLPDLKERIRTFKLLAQRVGPKRVIWRYDPIVISSISSFAFHERRFERLSRSLSGYTGRVIVSAVSYYRKTERRLGELADQGITVHKHGVDHPEMLALLSSLSTLALASGMEMQSCAEQRDLRPVGLSPASCIDGRLIQELGGTASLTKDPGQRPHCRCVPSRDIGVNDTCVHGCRYCYATRDPVLACRRHAEHDPRSPMLWGDPS
jgi:hypothetical protein